MAKTSQSGLVVRNTAFLGIAQGSSRALLAFTAILLANYLGKDTYDLYATALSFVAPFALLTHLGFSNVFLRECARDTSLTPQYLGATALLNSVLTGAALVFMVVLASVVDFGRDVFILCVILGTASLLSGLRITFDTVFQAHQRMHFTAGILVLGNVLCAGGVIAAIGLNASVFTISALYLAANVLTLLLSIALSFRIAWPKLDWSLTRSIVAPGIFFGVNNLMVILYTQGNAFVLSVYKLKEEAGTFKAAFTLITFVQIIPQIVSRALFPAIYALADSRERMIKAVTRVNRYITAMGMLIAIVLFGRADWIIRLLYGADFGPSALILKILAPALGCRFGLLILTNVMYASRKERYMTLLMSSLAAFDLLLCIAMVPRFGAVAASGAYLATQVIFWIINGIRTEFLLGRPKLWAPLIMPLIATLVTGVGLALTNDWPLISLLAAPVVFYGVLFATRYYTLGEFHRLARSAMGKD